MNPAKISKIARQESWRKELNRPLYHTQKWWATRLGSVFRAIIIDYFLKENNDGFYAHYNFKDKYIFDPFMGSGTTLGEGLKLGAKAIGSDINPVSFFGVKQALTNMPINTLTTTFKELENDIKGEIVANHVNSQGDPVLYYLWVQVITIEEAEIPLFKTYIFSKNAYPKKHPEAKALCPHCWQVLDCKYDSKNEVCPHCSKRFNPQNGPVKGQYFEYKGRKYKIRDYIKGDNIFDEKMFAKVVVTGKNKKKYEGIDDFDRQLYLSVQSKLKNAELLPLPVGEIRNGNNTDQIIKYNYKKWSDLFNARQLYSLGILLSGIKKINNSAVRNQFLSLFTGVLEYNNRFNTYKGEGTGAVRSIFYNHILKSEHVYVENSVWSTTKSSGSFNGLFKTRLVRAKEYLSNPFEVVPKDYQAEFGKKVYCDNAIKTKFASSWKKMQEDNDNLLLFNKDSSSIPIPDNTVDLVLTDPPFFDFIHYSELSDFFYAWLRPILNGKNIGFEERNSSRENEVQSTDAEKFSLALSSVLTESARVVKPNGSVVFSFHHSRPEGWLSLYSAIYNAGLEIYNVVPIIDDFGSATVKLKTVSPMNVDIFFYTRVRRTKTVYFTKDIDYFQQLYQAEHVNLTQGDIYAIKTAVEMVKASERKDDVSTLKPILENIYAISK